MLVTDLDHLESRDFRLLPSTLIVVLNPNVYQNQSQSWTFCKLGPLGKIFGRERYVLCRFCTEFYVLPTPLCIESRTLLVEDGSYFFRAGTLQTRHAI